MLHIAQGNDLQHFEQAVKLQRCTYQFRFYQGAFYLGK